MTLSTFLIQYLEPLQKKAGLNEDARYCANIGLILKLQLRDFITPEEAYRASCEIYPKEEV